MNRDKLLKHLLFLMFFIFIMNILALKFYWYFSIWYFDIIMHFMGGFWVGLAVIYFFQIEDRPSSFILKILFFVLLVGIGWEVFELVVNETIAQNPFDYLDTISDIFFDLFGGLCAILYLLVPLENQWTCKK